MGHSNGRRWTLKLAGRRYLVIFPKGEKAQVYRMISGRWSAGAVTSEERSDVLKAQAML